MSPILEPGHGGEVDAAADFYGIPRDRWLDLSTGINPNAYPLPDLAPEYWHNLPDASLDVWLRETAASYYGCADPGVVVTAPGSQAVIQWLPRLLPASSVTIVGPTYREHAACWSAAGHRVREITSTSGVDEQADVVVVANPNNPDGRLSDPQSLLDLASGRLLIVDEAFADVSPEISLGAHAGRPDLVVLRSFGKFFGLAGMRLGFALVGEPLAERLRRAFGPWPVSGPAAAVGAVALSDEPWARATRVRLKAAAGRLDGLLVRAGLRVAGGTALFRLVDLARGAELFDLLAREAILVRRFSEQPHWLRFGIPGDDEAFERLASALSRWRPQPVAPGVSLSRPARRSAAAGGTSGGDG